MPKTKKWLKLKKVVGFLVLFLSSLAISGCSSLNTGTPAALQVSSKPQATVFLDGKLLGQTPYFSDQLKNGNHTLKITTSDASFAANINLTAQTLTVVNRDLASNFLAQAGEILSLVPSAKGLSVVSYPQGADIEIDGKLFGKTPNLITQIENGDHKLTLSTRGYITRDINIKIVPNFRLDAQVTLASELAKGVVNPQVPPPLSQNPKVEILNTPQGFLRVHSEPTLESSETGRVSPGKEYEVIQEIPDWDKISFDGQLGWVSSQFTKKVQTTQ